MAVHHEALFGAFTAVRYVFRLARQRGVVTHPGGGRRPGSPARCTAWGRTACQHNHLLAAHLLLGLFRYLDRRDGASNILSAAPSNGVFHPAFESRKAHCISFNGAWLEPRRMPVRAREQRRAGVFRAIACPNATSLLRVSTAYDYAMFHLTAINLPAPHPLRNRHYCEAGACGGRGEARIWRGWGD